MAESFFPFMSSLDFICLLITQGEIASKQYSLECCYLISVVFRERARGGERAINHGRRKN